MIYIYAGTFAEISAYPSLEGVPVSCRHPMGTTWREGPVADNKLAALWTISDDAGKIAKEAGIEESAINKIPSGCSLHLGTGYIYKIGEPDNVLEAVEL